ncbi:MAG: PKD domain-containing protein, partial [Luteibaculum sp.]
IFLFANPSPKIFVDDTVVVGCSPQDILLVDTLNANSGVLKYNWNLGDGSTSIDNPLRHSYNSPGEYDLWLEIISPLGCRAISSTPHKVIVNPSPLVAASADRYKTTIKDPKIQFFNESSSFIYWDWQFSDGTSTQDMDPLKTFSDTGIYVAELWVSNQYGCSATAELTIQINPFIKFSVPTGFTPNTGGSNGGHYSKDDLSNDVFYPITEYVSEFNMRIYNRWGELVFESNDINIGWDGYYKGKLSQQDVYIWQITASFVTGEKVSETGNVTLIWK